MEIEHLLSPLQSSKLDMKFKFLVVIKTYVMEKRGQVLTSVTLLTN